MARVVGIGGVFFHSKDPKKLGAWYRKHLGVDVQAWGGAVFPWESPKPGGRQRFTVWSPFADTKDFAPSKLPYMLNFIVDDLDGLMKKLRRAKARVDKKPIDENEFGRFAWVFDPEGRKLELWEPPRVPKGKAKRR